MENEENRIDINTDDENNKTKKEELKDKRIDDYGQVVLDKNKQNKKINLISIIGEIEGHEALPATTKTTKYEHLLPQLAELEDSEEIEGILFLINTVGGDVSAGLALAEMIASLSKPTVSLVLGDSHSIGVPLAVATDYSYIVPTGTMIIHPVRMSGTIIGAPQTYDYFKIIQDRIVGFISHHSRCKKERIEQMMMNTGILSKDLGTILVGEDAVNEGLINEVGGIREALEKVKSMIKKEQVELDKKEQVELDKKEQVKADKKEQVKSTIQKEQVKTDKKEQVELDKKEHIKTDKKTK